MPTNNLVEGVVLGIDIGDSRIGIARAHSVSRLPEPLTVVAVDDTYLDRIADIAKQEEAVLLVVGMPLPLSGGQNAQTQHIKDVATLIQTATKLPYVFVDESFTSKQADSFLQSNKLNQPSNDAIASCIILERYFQEGELQNA